MLFIALAAREVLRRPSCLVPPIAAALAALLTISTGLGRQLGNSDPEENWLGPSLLVGCLVAFLASRAERSASRHPTSPLRPIPATPRRVAPVVGWLAGSLAAAVAFSTLWIPVHVALLSQRPTSRDLLSGISLAVGAAAAVSLVVAILSALLPRAAAAAMSGVWLLMSSIPADPPTGLWSRLLAAPFFPVSRALLSADETSQLEHTLRALGSVALFDAGLFALLVVIEMRRSR